MNNESNKKAENKKIKKIKKLKVNKIVIIIGILVLVLLAILFSYLKSGNNNSKYGNRLNGINKVPVKKDVLKTIESHLKENENVDKADARVEGKIIYISFNIKEAVSKDDAKNIGNDSISVISEEIKNFYDINITITKSDEKGEEKEETNDSGEQVKVTVKEFPIMGYKKSTSSSIVW